MKLISRRKKSRASQAADIIGGALKLGAIYKAATGAGKGARKAAKGTAAYKAGKAAAKRAPGRKTIPVVLAAGGAGAVAVRKLRSSGDSEPILQPQQAAPPPPTSATTPA